VSDFQFDLPGYLQRIGYSDHPEVSAEALEALHRAQVYNIPFENFDILLERGISLDPADLYTKLVHKRRGGYCFELNGLFLMALQAAGFEARALLARVHLRDTPSSRSHQLSLVQLDGEDWIADVGFGANGLRAPIPLILDEEFEQDGEVFRLVDGGEFGTMLQAQVDDSWRNQYSIEMNIVCRSDIEMGNYYTATHPKSLFRQVNVATVPLANGRISLIDRRLRIERDGEVEESELPGGEAFWEAIAAHFDIDPRNA
jgi:N-hydroxyarylamine O-acetyltransferase